MLCMQSLSLLILFCIAGCRAAISCLDESGQPVGWWLVLKLPAGGSYIYADANAPAFVNSTFAVDSGTDGAFLQTIAQIYSGDAALGYVVYNDQQPGGGDSSSYGHSKGVVAWDSSTVFWFVHSYPKFPNAIEDGFSPVDESQTLYGQSTLCVSTDLDGLDTIGTQLQYNEPQIYDYATPMGTPDSILELINSSSINVTRVKLRGDSQVAQFTASDGTTFTSCSKDGDWGQVPQIGWSIL